MSQGDLTTQNEFQDVSSPRTAFDIFMRAGGAKEAAKERLYNMLKTPLDDQDTIGIIATAPVSFIKQALTSSLSMDSAQPIALMEREIERNAGKKNRYDSDFINEILPKQIEKFKNSFPMAEHSQLDIDAYVREICVHTVNRADGFANSPKDKSDHGQPVFARYRDPDVKELDFN